MPNTDSKLRSNAACEGLTYASENVLDTKRDDRREHDEKGHLTNNGRRYHRSRRKRFRDCTNDASETTFGDELEHREHQCVVLFSELGHKDDVNRK